MSCPKIPDRADDEALLACLSGRRSGRSYRDLAQEAGYSEGGLRSVLSRIKRSDLAVSVASGEVRDVVLDGYS